MNDESRPKAAFETSAQTTKASVQPGSDTTAEPTPGRAVFSTPRAAEFLERRALQSQTGQPVHRFGDVVVKELVDNALDAAESAGVAPVIDVAVVVDGDVQRVTVTDNGPGMPADVVEAILDFNVLVSDKAAYRSPTRGLQGNAFKTLLGIPHALGIAEPVVVEACGVRHEITAGLDPGGNVAVRHEQPASTRTVGTSVTVPLPITQAVDIGRWLQGFAVTNPHATFGWHGNRGDGGDSVSYKPTVTEGWSKPVPSDPTSIHWYDEPALTKLVFAHIAAARNGGRDIPLGEFVRTFDGLTSTGKAKTVRAELPGVERLSDFERDPDLVGVLLKAMRATARAPKPAALGHLGENHLQARLGAAFGVERSWYRRKAVDHDGVGWELEVLITETRRPGAVIYGTNYSPSFGDPLGATWLRGDDVAAQGAGSLLARSDAKPEEHDNDGLRAVVVHVICAAPEFTDKGKVALTVPDAVAAEFGKTIAAATKTLRTEQKRAERDARAQANRRAESRRRTEAGAKVTQKDAVVAVMAKAIEKESGNGRLPFPTRNLFYTVRKLIQRYGVQFEAKRSYDYFSQTLVVEYEQIHGPIPGHYRDPRGELHEPHTGKVVRLGTREVAEYLFPPHVFKRIMYVEKKGLGRVFEAVQLAERYDMAIAYGEGQPAEAVRALFARADAGDYELFVLHDADPAGYSIARTIAEETARMPNHRVDVVDLGLCVADAISLDTDPETFTRKKALPAWMTDRLDEIEQEWFEGRLVVPKGREGGPQWECQRVELNGPTTPQLIAHIEAQLARHGATSKVIPPRQVIGDYGRGAVDGVVRDTVQQVLAELGLDIDDMATEIAPGFYTPRVVGIKQSTVNRRLRHNSPNPWRSAVADEINRRLDHTKVKARVRGLIAERIDQVGGGPR